MTLIWFPPQALATRAGSANRSPTDVILQEAENVGITLDEVYRVLVTMDSAAANVLAENLRGKSPSPSLLTSLPPYLPPSLSLSCVCVLYVHALLLHICNQFKELKCPIK
jgi:hypothetical protein